MVIDQLIANWCTSWAWWWVESSQWTVFCDSWSRNAGRTLEDDETGNPTVVNGEHLDPYNVSRWQMVDLRDADADVFFCCSPCVAFQCNYIFQYSVDNVNVFQYSTDNHWIAFQCVSILNGHLNISNYSVDIFELFAQCGPSIIRLVYN